MSEMVNINEEVDDATKRAFVLSPTRNLMSHIRAYSGAAIIKVKRLLSRLDKKWKKIPLLPQLVSFVFSVLGELIAIILGLTFFWLCAINIVLAQQSVDLAPFKTDAQIWFENAFEGHRADVGELRLDWNAIQNTFTFHAGDISVYDALDNTVERVENITTELALMDVMRGKFDPFHMQISGGEVTLLRHKNGHLIAGLGTPKTVGRLGPVWRHDPEKTQTQSLGWWHNIHIKSLNVTQAVFHLVDEMDGFAWELSETDVGLIRTQDELTFTGKSFIKLSDPDVSSDDGANDKATFVLSGTLSPDLEDVVSDISVTGFNPAELLPKSDFYGALAGIDAPLTFDIKLIAKQTVGLQKLEVSGKAEGGHFRVGDRQIPLKAATVAAHYSPQNEQLDISDISLVSEAVTLTGRAKLGNIGSPAKGFLKDKSDFELNFDQLHFDMTPQFESPFDIKTVILKGDYNRPDKMANFTQIYGDFGNFQPNLVGEVKQKKNGELSHAKLMGPINGKVSPEELLELWPPKMVDGARRWVKRSALDGVLENINLDVNITEEMLSELPPLRDEAVTLSFDYIDGVVRYISTMTPATDIQASGVIHGNSGEFVLTSGKIGDVILTDGEVGLPVFYPYGGDLNIDVSGVGPLSQLVTLIDQKPFEYASQYGVDPTAFSGAANVNLKVTRPLLVHFNQDRINYTISGSASDIQAPFGIGPYQVENGEMTLYADREGLIVKGPANIGPWRPDIEWRETFDQGATPTRYSVSGTLGRDEFDRFGIGLREYFGGDIHVDIDAQANGLEIKSADVIADLTQSEMRIGSYWTKPIGSKGTFTGELSRQQDGRVRVNDIVINAAGLDIEGHLDIAGDFRLLDLDFKKAKITNFVDAALQVKPNDNGERFDLFLTGDYLDVSSFMSGMINTQSNAFDVPILLTASLRRLVLNDAFSLRDSNVLFAHDGVGVRQARLKGDTLEGALVAEITTNDALEIRTMNIDLPSASEAAYAFFGINSLIGGRMQIDGTMPATGKFGPMKGEVVIEDVRVVNAPVMTQLLSLASLQGLVDIMAGEGLKFESLIVPFSLEKQVLSLRDARAAGPALGMTSNGEISFADKVLELDGVLVPAYTANSLLGSIPVIGDIFVGKKGEGIFALSYTMRGPFSKSQIAVNPLSALTPGFLRGIFRPERQALPPSVLEQIESVRPEENAPK